MRQGQFETELDFRGCGTIRESLASVGLIGWDFDNEESLKSYSDALLIRVIEKVLPIIPITLRKFDDCIIKCRRLFNAVLFENSIPVTDLPPCILTEMLDHKEEKVKQFWKKKTKDQLTLILRAIPDDLEVPSMDQLLEATKDNPVAWNPNEVITQSADQSLESYQEQTLAREIGKCLIDKYSNQFGDASQTKNCIVHGCPGAGKTFVQQINILYAISQGLRTMSTSLQANRSNGIGGIHLHKLLCWDVGTVRVILIMLYIRTTNRV